MLLPEEARNIKSERGKGTCRVNSLSDVWQNVLDHMAEQLSETTIRTWFDEVSVVTMEDSAFVLHCSNGFKEKYDRGPLHALLSKDALRDIFRRILRSSSSTTSSSPPTTA